MDGIEAGRRKVLYDMRMAETDGWMDGYHDLDIEESYITNQENKGLISADRGTKAHSHTYNTPFFI